MQLYSPESVYQLDRAAVSEDRLSEIELMQRAGEYVWRSICERWPRLGAITVFAGAGNNGGDAFVVALDALRQGVDVQLLVQGDLDRQSPTSKHFRLLYEQAGGKYEHWNQQAFQGELIVDGLLGIGLQRDLDASWQALVTAINSSALACVAIDIPSGLNGRTGVAQPIAVEASLTITFIGRKTGQFLADGPDYCGELLFADLGVSRRVRASQPAALETIESCRLPRPRKRNSHKNHYGNLLIVGGDRGMSGAVTLAARAALRSGAGLVTALVHPDCRGDLAAFPEIMTLGWEALDAKLENATVVVVGPGLGESGAARECLERLETASQAMVIDASALKQQFLHDLATSTKVITPHPGEAARLLSSTTRAVQGDRIEACRQLIDSFGATTVLKGSGTLIGDDETGPLAINTCGNPGMASAGMGDVLSGIIAAFLGQGLAPFEAARSAVHLHARCADAWSRNRDQCGLMAGDIIDLIPEVMCSLREEQ